MSSNVIFLGATDNYPAKFTATNSKNELIARGLLNHTDKVSIINSPFGLSGLPATGQTGTREGIEYHIFPKNGKLSLIKNIKSIYKLLKEKRSKAQQNVLIMEHSYYPFFLLYVFFAKRLNYKTVVTITEWHLYFPEITPVKRFDFFVFDYTFGYFVKGIFPISTLLEEKVARFKKPVLKVPILADFEMLKPVNYDIKDESAEYFMYCGTAGYFTVIQFIIKSFSIFTARGHKQKLKLVLSGSAHMIQKVEDLITQEGLQGKVVIEQKLPFAKLLEGYQYALALLIPLRPDKQDKARFSHKIGEYLSSGRPIITGNIGEIEHYFEHKKNALIATEYTEAAYADLMSLAANDKQLANNVGLEGRKLGETTFNYTTYGQLTNDFLNKL
jgi:glycosyltransferase involved in cell wall biosynthesis